MALLIVQLKAYLFANLPGILAVVLPLLGAWLRAWLQKHTAVSATAMVELEARVREVTPYLVSLTDPEKKQLAMQELKARLPLLLRPISASGLGKLVEAAVPEGQKRAGAMPLAPTVPPPPPHATS